jgi:crotonobetainyl-CoA:carnitine CoA-transferase CaiB-like acyl-CoA transferase
VGGVVPGRIGNRHPTVVPYKTFEVADGSMIIAVGNDGQFRLLCDELGIREYGEDPRFATSRARLENREAIEAVIQERVRGVGKDEIIARLVARGVPAGPVNTIDQTFGDPFVEARKTVHHFTRPDGVKIPTVAFPGKLSETPADYRYQPPRVGEHTIDILREWLDCDDEEISRLVASGAIAQRDDEQASAS